MAGLLVFVPFVFASLGCAGRPQRASTRQSKYLFVWAGPNGPDSVTRTGTSRDHDFLAVVDVDPASRTYGRVLASVDAGAAGAMAHHMELTFPDRHALFASDYTTGQIFLFDLTNPRAPRLVTRIDSVPGYRYPHSFARLRNGHVVASLQHGDGTRIGDPGGLAEFDTSGHLVRTSSATDTAFPGASIRPNGVELMPAIDRIVTTSMPMADEPSTDVVQVWRLSDLRLLHTIAVPSAAHDSSGMYPYDVRVLGDGRTGMLNTYRCALFRVSGVETEHPRVDLVHTLHDARTEGCAVAVVVGHYWVIPAAYGRAVVSLDVTDPSNPVEVSRLHTDSTFHPHWLSADPTSDRIVVNSADDGDARVLIAHLDQRTGRLTWDDRFRDAGSRRLGLDFSQQRWPRAVHTPVMAHSAVFGSGG